MSKLKIGQKLLINREEYGLLIKKSDSVMVYDPRKKQIITFSSFNTALDEMCKETLSYVKKIKENIKKLKVGQAFTVISGEKFYFLKLTNNSIEFSKGDEKEYVVNYLYFKEALDEINEDVKNMPRLVDHKSSLDSMSLEEKIKTGLAMFKYDFSNDGNDKNDKIEILELGSIKLGEAYYHEVNDYYEIIGIEIKYKYKFDFMNDEKTAIGFFPIWVGKRHKCAPICFEESFSDNFGAHNYTNGCGDHVVIFTTLHTKKEVEESASLIDLSKYSIK